MPRTPRKGLTGRMKSGQAMLAAAETHLDTAADDMAEKLREDLPEGEDMPDIRQYYRPLCQCT